MKNIIETPIFKIIEDTHKKRKVVRIESLDWVNIFAFNKNKELLLIKQFRLGTNSYTLETPGGLIDPEDVDNLHAAKRELQEETGYTSKTWRELGWVYANPAYQNNRCLYFIAENVIQTHEQNLDPLEDIPEAKFHSMEKILEMIKNHTLTHSIVLAGLSIYLTENQKN